MVLQLKEQLSESESERGILAYQVSKLENDVHRLKEQAKDYEAKCKDNNLSLKFKFESLKAELERANSENERLRDDLEARNGQQEFLDKELSAANDKARGTQEELDAAKALLARKDCHVCQLKQELEQHKVQHHRELSNCSMKTEKTALDLKRALTANKEYKFKLEELETRNLDISGALERASQDRLRFEVENKKLQSLVDNFRNQEEENEDRLKRLKKDVSRRENELRKVCEFKELERRERVDRANKRMFSQKEKAGQIELMDELLREIDDKYVSKGGLFF